VLALLLFILILVSVYSNTQIRRISYPAYDYITKKARKEAEDILKHAMDDARQLRVDAEIEGIKHVARENLEIKSLEAQYKKTLEETVKETEVVLNSYKQSIKKNLEEIAFQTESQIKTYLPSIKNEAIHSQERTKEVLGLLEKELHKTETVYAQFVESLREETQKQFKESKEVMRKGIAELPSELNKSLRALEKTGERVIKEKIDKEFEDARGVIGKYRDNYMLFLDKYIVSLVEDTTELALEKKLSMEEHAHLVHVALEEAKKEGVFDTPR